MGRLSQPTHSENNTYEKSKTKYALKKEFFQSPYREINHLNLLLLTTNIDGTFI